MTNVVSTVTATRDQMRGAGGMWDCGCMCSISRMQPRPSALCVVPATRNPRTAQLSLRAPRAVVVSRPPPRLVRSDVLRLRYTPQCSVTQPSVCALYRTPRSFSRKLISMWMRRFYLFNTKTSEMLFALWSARICFAFGQTSCEGLTTSFQLRWVSYKTFYRCKLFTKLQ